MTAPDTLLLSCKRDLHSFSGTTHPETGKMCIRDREKTVLFDENHIPISGSPGHGIGTRSILAYAHKNNAAVDYQLEKGFFKLRILFPPAPESMKQPG